MKKIKLLLLLLTMLSSIQLFSQNYDTTYVVKYVDEMTGKSSLFSSRQLIISNENRSIGFTIIVAFRNEIILATSMVGISGCNENDKLIILLENGEKINLTSWNEFNCKGSSFFTLSSIDVNKLKLSPLAKIRITNGRSLDSYTGDVKLQDKYFFIQLFNSYNTGNYIILN